jgi:GGDEF domain-containing protein
MESFVVLTLKRGKARLVRFSLELKGEVVGPLEELDLAAALKQWKPDLLTLSEAEADELKEQFGGFGEHVLVVPPIPRGREASFTGSIALTVPSSMDPLRPKELLTTMLRSLLISHLTGLPAGWVLEAEVERRLRGRIPSGFLYADMNDFKGYNDGYGPGHGDNAIEFLAGQVVAAAKSKGTPADICAHIGGDDFFIITSPERTDAVGEELIRLFDLRADDLYEEKDREQGFVEPTYAEGPSGGPRRERRGHKHLIPMTLSVVSTTNTQRGDIDSYLKLGGEILGELKGVAKEQAESSRRSVYLRDRRRGPGGKRGLSSPQG